MWYSVAFKDAVKRAAKTCNLSCDIAAKWVEQRCCAFYHQHQTCLTTNQLAVRCEKWLQKVESSSTFCNKLCPCCTFYRRKANLICRKWRNSCVWCYSLVILSNQKSVFTKLARTWFVTRQVWAWVVIRATFAFQRVVQQCCKISCTFLLPVWPQLKGKTRYLSLIHIWRCRRAI